MFGFNTLWNYTTLKPSILISSNTLCFNTLWNYTTLKRNVPISAELRVLIPYEITLLSNWPRKHYARGWVLIPYEITLLSNKNVPTHTLFVSFNTLWNYTTLKHLNKLNDFLQVLIPYEITLLSNINATFTAFSMF